MDTSKVGALVDSLIEVGKVLAPLIIPGSGPLIEAGEKLIKSIDHAREVAAADSVAELDALRGDLDARVNAKVDDVVDQLRKPDTTGVSRDFRDPKK